MPRTRDFSGAIAVPGWEPDGRLPDRKPMTEVRERAERRAHGEGDWEAMRWISAGGNVSDGAAVARAARDALRAVNDRRDVAAMRTSFQIRAFHRGFREGVADWVFRQEVEREIAAATPFELVPWEASHGGW